MEVITAPVAAGSIELSSLSDDEVLAFTRGVRVKVVNALFTAGAVSGENSDRILLTNMLNGLDSQAVSSKRLVNDKQKTDNASALIAAVLDGVDKNTIFTGLVTDVVANAERNQLGSDIPTPVSVPGELDVVAPQMDFSSFLRSQGKDEDALGANAEEPEEDGEY